MSSAVPDGWVDSPLGKFLKFRRGTSYVASELSEDAYSHPLYITMKSFKVGGGYSVRGDKYYSPPYERNQVVEHDEILFANTDVTSSCDILGAPLLLPRERLRADVLFSHHVTAAKILKNVDKDFLFYLLSSPSVRQVVQSCGRGTTVKMLDMKDIGKLSFSLPPLPEQKKIASILTSVDEVIENTQKQIDKLQDLKKATMNELLTKGIGHTEFKDSELGRIPKSWEVRSLSEVSELSRGKFSHRPRNDPAFYDGDFPFLQTGDIPTDNLDIAYFSQSLNEKGLQVSRLFPKGTLVMTIAATVGEVASLTFDSCFPDSLVGITANESLVRQYFLLFCLRFRKQVLIQEAPESAQKNLNLDILNPFQVAVPPLHEQRAIESTLLSIQKHIEKNKTKLSQTQSLKKSLMQDLLTGNVRVTLN